MSILLYRRKGIANEVNNGQCNEEKKVGGEEDAELRVRREYSNGEIEKWKSYYRCKKNMEDYLIDTYQQDKNKSLLKNQESFIGSKAELAILAHKPNDFIAKHGVLYRWKLQYERNFETDDEACYVVTHVTKLLKEMNEDSDCPIPDGWRYMLQLRVTRGGWKDWIYVKKRVDSVSKVGVFAARDFANGTKIGYYTGPIVWSESVARTGKPSDQYLRLQGVPGSPLSLLMRNHEAKCVVVDPLGVQRGRTTAMYLGMHFVNSACGCLGEGSSESSRVKVVGNCIVGEDGCVTTCKKIPPHTELLWEQNAEDEDEGKLDKKTRERKQEAAKRKAFLDIASARKRRMI